MSKSIWSVGFPPNGPCPKERSFFGIPSLTPPSIEGKTFQEFHNQYEMVSSICLHPVYIFQSELSKKFTCRTQIVSGELRQTLVQRPSGRKSLTFKLNRRSPLVYRIDSLNHQLKKSQTFIKFQIFHIWQKIYPENHKNWQHSIKSIKKSCFFYSKHFSFSCLGILTWHLEKRHVESGDPVEDVFQTTLGPSWTAVPGHSHYINMIIKSNLAKRCRQQIQKLVLYDVLAMHSRHFCKYSQFWQENSRDLVVDIFLHRWIRWLFLTLIR